MVFVYANNLHRIKMHIISLCAARDQLIAEGQKVKIWWGQMTGMRWEDKGLQMERDAEGAEMNAGKTFDLQCTSVR